MTKLRIFRYSGPLIAAIALLPAACAQQPGGMSGMNMPGHDMSGMDMQTMMSHCARMRQETRQGVAMSPDMQSMMAQCNQMDQQMGGPASSAAPEPRMRTR